MLKPFSVVDPSHGLISMNFSTKSIMATNSKEKKKKRSKEKVKATEKPSAKMGLVKEKRRTRSSKEYEYDSIIQQSVSHIPVLLGEVLDVFSSSRSISSFIDCTLGAAGHSSAVSIPFSHLDSSS